MADIDDTQQVIERLLKYFAGHAEGSRSKYSAREQSLIDIFEHCGLQPRRGLQIGTHTQPIEVDAEIELNIGGQCQRVAIEIKGANNVEVISRAIEQAQRIRHMGRYDRALVIVGGEIAEVVRHRSEAQSIGYIDLLGIPELRSWLWKHAPALQPAEAAGETTCAQIIREAMRAIAERLARAPDEIAMIEWRDMKRVLREIFEGLGFGTALTRSSRDGGFDLSLEIDSAVGRETYLVEVKHWTDQKPGRRISANLCVSRPNRTLLEASYCPAQASLHPSMKELLVPSVPRSDWAVERRLSRCARLITASATKSGYRSVRVQRSCLMDCNSAQNGRWQSLKHSTPCGQRRS
ncbi:hypothetical protein HFO02_05205 [Rhizobium laguerreae]|nr:restriction endonuclease [Rhizobium laguerreae]MBY3323018.1 hypothetical protein [Rhizobium laguerreae]